MKHKILHTDLAIHIPVCNLQAESLQSFLCGKEATHIGFPQQGAEKPI